MEAFKLKHGAKRLCGFRQLYRVRICSLRSTLAKADKAAGEVHRIGIPPGTVVHAQPFQNKIAATKPFHGDTLLGDDQHRQNEQDDNLRVGIRFCHMFA